MTTPSVWSSAWVDAVSSLYGDLRAERIQGSYSQMFVENGRLALVMNSQNQVIYGRRGSGKSHLVGCVYEGFRNEIASRHILPARVDMRELGTVSSAQTASDGLAEAVMYYRTLLVKLCFELVKELGWYVNGQGTLIERLIKNTKLVLSGKDELIRGHLVQILSLAKCGEQMDALGDVELVDDISEAIRISFGMGDKGPKAEAGMDSSLKQQAKYKSIAYIGFTQVRESLEAIVEASGLTHVCFLLDEWSSVRQEVQPYLAELIERGLFSKRVSFKIAAIPFRTRLSRPIGNTPIGLEVGADVFSVSLDNIMLYEEHQQAAKDFHMNLLHKHLSPYLEAKGIRVTVGSLVSLLFTNQAITELAIAGGGVPRDFLNLFVKSYQAALNLHQRIGIGEVRRGAEEWYREDKKKEVSANTTALDLLNDIVNDVVYKKKKTHFLVRADQSQYEYLQMLVDLRALHVRKEGYSHQDRPGIRYDVYAIDYGCYTDLRITRRQLDKDAENDLKTVENLRDIRRVELDPEIIEKHKRKTGQLLLCPNCKKFFNPTHQVFVKHSVCPECGEGIKKPS